MAGSKRGKQGVSTGSIEKSKARLKREAKARRAQEREWAAKSGPVKSVRMPTPIGFGKKEAPCTGNPYAGMKSGECAADVSYVCGAELPAGFVLAAVCDQHVAAVLEFMREYGSGDDPLVQSFDAFTKALAAENGDPAELVAKFRDVVGGAS